VHAAVAGEQQVLGFDLDPAVLALAENELAEAELAEAELLAEQAGSNSGLGYLFEQSIAQVLTARAYAAVVILSLFAISLFALLSAAQRLALPWAHPPTGDRSQ